LAALLWPDWSDREARSNLRYALSDLRSAIGDREASPPFLSITRDSIQFNLDSHHHIDVGEFAQLLSASGTAFQDIGGLEKAVSLYQGEFLEGFSISDSPPFQEWLLLKREYLHRGLVDALRQLSAVYEEGREFERALPYARRQVELEPWQEDGHRQVIRLLAESGQPGAALAQYETCRQLMEVDLGTEPSEQTRELYRQIQNGEWGRGDASTIITPERPDIPLGECPYRGLAAFQEQDAANFYGREGFVEQLLVTLQRGPLVAGVVGSSGSGKSSVVYAGLLPILRADEGWLVVDFRPGVNPFRSMAAALIPWLEPELNETDSLVETRKLGDALDKEELSLQEVVARSLEKLPDCDHVLLFVDQFEELYTLCTEVERQRRFVDHLLSAVEAEKSRRSDSLVVLLTLRADFMGQALAYRRFADALQDASLMLGPMNTAELRAAIEKPAENQGAVFEEGLVDRILEDVGEEPGKLPLLEFALTLLWEGSASGTLSHTTYKGIGGVEGALARYAEEVFTDLDENEQKVARQVIVQLVQPGVGTEDTRRVASRAEIGETYWSLTQTLADKRLVVTGQDVEGRETAEVVHEALIQRWERLRGWIEGARAFRIWQEGLRAAIHQWEDTDLDEGALLRGVPLMQAESWLDERENELSEIETGFIQASLNLRSRRQVERERRRRRIILGLGVGLVLTLILAVFAGLQWRQAGQQRNAAVQSQATAAVERDQTNIALAGLLAAQTYNLMEQEYDLALLLGVESIQRVETIEGRGSLYAALNQGSQLLKFLHGHQDDVRSVAFHPGGNLLASGSADGEIFLWDLTTGQPFGDPLNGHQEQVSSLAFSPDGTVLASAGFDDTVMLWDVDKSSSTFGQIVRGPLNDHDGNVWSMAFHPDGDVLASGSADKTIILWDVDKDSGTYGKQIAEPLSGHNGIVSSLAFSPDGITLASGSADKTVILWDVNAREPLTEPLDGHQAFVSGVAFSPDGRTLASGSKDNTIQLWEMDKNSEVFGQPIGEPLISHTDNVWSLAFSPAGDQLASSSDDGTVLLWDVDQASDSFGGPIGLPLSAHAGPVYSLGFSPDGSTIASGGADHNVLLWNKTPENALVRELLKITDSLWWVSFSPDRSRLAWAEPDGTIHLWNADKASDSFGQPVGRPLVGHTNFINCVAFSPDGKTLASASDDTTIMLWDLDEASASFGQPLGAPLEGHTHDVTDVFFSPDGMTLASGSNDRTIQLWDVDTDSTTFGQLLHAPLEGHTDAVWFTGFNPQGSLLASGSEDGTVRFWDVGRDSPTFGQQIGSSLEGHAGAVLPVLFTPNGKILASGYSDGTIRLWDAERDSGTFGQQLGAPLSGIQAQVGRMAFSPDGKNLVSVDFGGVTLMWDVITRRAMEIPVHGSSGEGVSARELFFNTDGQSLIAVLKDSRIIELDLSVESWQALACQRANRNLTQAEWQRYFGEQPYRATCPELYDHSGDELTGEEKLPVFPSRSSGLSD